MKKLKSFVFITSILGGMLLSGCSAPGGLQKKMQRSAGNTTVSIVFGDCGYENEKKVTETLFDSVAKINFAKASGSNDPAYFTSDKTLRTYSKNTTTISVLDDYEIVSYKLTFKVKDSGILQLDTTTIKSGDSYSPASGTTSLLFTTSQSSGSKGKIQFTEMSVTYKSTSSGETTEDSTTEDSTTEEPTTTSEDPTTSEESTTSVDPENSTTASITIKAVADANSWSNGQPYATSAANAFNVDENISCYTTGTGDNGKYYTSDQSWRIYKNGDGNIIINSSDDKPIIRFNIAYNQNKNGKLRYNGDVIESGSNVDVNNASQVTLNASDGTSANVTSISVTYLLPVVNNKTVSFNAGAGTGTMESVEVAAGSTYTLPESTFTPAEGYEFKAWLVGEEEKGVGAEITVNDNIEITAIYQATSDLYIMSTMSDPAWKAHAEYKLIANTKERADADYDYYLKEVIFLEGAEFKIAKADWSFSYGSANLRNDYYVSGHEGDDNIVVNEEGIYDVYVDLNYHKVAVVKSAFDIFKQQDLNYTRDTLINLNSDSFKDVKEDNYFDQITVHRTTSFIDNALFMTSIDEAINSGYYTRKNENSGKNMYHYNMVGNASQAYEVDGEIENQRHDSSTTSVNDFFINGHYFNVLAEEFAVGFDYDMYEDHYYCGTNIADELFEDFLAFTAPLLVINDQVQFEFSGVAIQDLCGETQFKLFASSETEHIEGGSSLFSTATLTKIGSTEIQALQKYINQEIA